jgi:hypothetical protein
MMMKTLAASPRTPWAHWPTWHPGVPEEGGEHEEQGAGWGWSA